MSVLEIKKTQIQIFLCWCFIHFSFYKTSKKFPRFLYGVITTFSKRFLYLKITMSYNEKLIRNRVSIVRKRTTALQGRKRSAWKVCNVARSFERQIIICSKESYILRIKDIANRIKWNKQSFIFHKFGQNFKNFQHFDGNTVKEGNSSI